MIRLYVGGFPYATTPEDLRKLFSAIADLESIHLPLDKEREKPRGFGFVEVQTTAAAVALIDTFDGVEFGGRTLTVNIARPREAFFRRLSRPVKLENLWQLIDETSSVDHDGDLSIQGDVAVLHAASTAVARLHESRRYREMILAIANDTSQIWAIHWRELEFLIAEALELEGFRCIVTSAQKDGGYDIVAHKDHDLLPYKMYVEVKHWRKPVGVEIVNQLYAVVTRKSAANGGTLLTTGTITSEARKLAIESNIINTVDGKQAQEWLVKIANEHLRQR